MRQGVHENKLALHYASLCHSPSLLCAQKYAHLSGATRPLTCARGTRNEALGANGPGYLFLVQILFVRIFGCDIAFALCPDI